MQLHQHPCSRCGSVSRTDEHGLCARCLFSAALETDEKLTDDTFGRYEPIAVLGEGGMGVVYLAEQTTPFHRCVALKVLKREPGESIGGRFAREQQSLAKLDHPNIAAIFDAGTSANGVPYFAMEYVEGSPITEYCDEQRLTISDRIGLFLRVCSAVEYSHRHGIVHGDLKPENLLAAWNGGEHLVKVIDFGLARMEEWHRSARRDAAAGAQIVGTPEYMSPEQAESQTGRADPRADVYSLGMILYELLVGALPFDVSAWGERGLGEILRVLEEVPAPAPGRRFGELAGQGAISERRRMSAAALRRELSGDLAVIVMKAIAKSPAARYGSAGELAADLQRYLRLEPVLANRQGPGYRTKKWARRHASILAVTVLVGGITATSLLVYFARSKGPAFAVGEFVPYTSSDGYESAPSFSPDGKKVVFTWSGARETNYDIYMAGSLGEAPRRLTTDPGQDVSPAWSPDGKTVAFLRGTEPMKSRLLLLDLATGREREVASLHAWYAPETRNLSWSPDGKWLAAVDRDEQRAASAIRLFSPVSGEFRTVLVSPPGVEALHPSFSNDGRAIAFTWDEVQKSSIWVQRLSPDGRPVGKPTRAREYGRFPAWIGPEDLLLLSYQGQRGRIWTVQAAGGPSQPVDQLGDSVADVATSRDGSLVAVTRKLFNVDVWRYGLDRQGATPAPETFAASTFGDYEAEISPLGTRAAFVSTRSGKRQVWMAALDGSDLHQMTFGDEVRRGPNWLPDGRAIRFGTRKGEDRKFFLLDLSSGRLNFERNDYYVEGATLDGRVLFLRKAIGDPDKLFRAEKDGATEPKPVSAKPTLYARFDPAGRWIYFVDRYSGPATLWRVPMAGGPEQEVERDVLCGPFAASRSGVYFTKPLGGAKYGVYYRGTDEKKTRLLFEMNKRPYLKLSVSEDDRDLLVDVAAQEGSDILVARIERR